MVTGLLMLPSFAVADTGDRLAAGERLATGIALQRDVPASRRSALRTWGLGSNGTESTVEDSI